MASSTVTKTQAQISLGVAICNATVQTIAHALCEEDVPNVGLVGSYLLADALEAEAIPFVIKSGVVSLGARNFKQAYHIWLEYEGHVLDVGKRVEELRGCKTIPCTYKARASYKLTENDKILQSLDHSKRAEYWSSASDDVKEARTEVQLAIQDQREAILRGLASVQPQKHKEGCDCEHHKH